MGVVQKWERIMFGKKKVARLLQTLAVIHHFFIWILMPFISFLLPIYIIFFTQLWWAMFLYTLWYVYDFSTPRRGSRRWNWYKNSSIWKYFADYFPITLVKTKDLKPKRNYIMGCHPHGVLSIGAFTHLCTNGTGFSDKFPGIDSTILTLNGQFWFPFRREIGIGLGGVESSSSSLKYLLANPGKGRLIGIVIGGAEEVLDAKPGKHDLNLMGRRGFCKHAIQHGAYLVPSYSFGENDVYNQYDNNERGTYFRAIQSAIKKRIGFCPPLPIGRSPFTIDRFGFLPFRRPITTVVGAPIKVQKILKPTNEQVEALYTKYCDALKELFETHKTKYGVPADVHLNLF